MIKDEALKLALEALENNRQTHHYCEDTWYSCPKHEDGCANDAEGDECNCGADKANAEIDATITAIKEALAQPEHGWTPERIAGMSRLKEAQDKRQEFPKRFDTHPTPSQRTWVGLTDEEKADLFAGTAPYYNEVDYADAIEAALKTKNT